MTEWRAGSTAARGIARTAAGAAARWWQMLFTIVGLPGRFTETCAALTARLIEQALGPVFSTSGDTLAQITRSLLRAAAPNIVLLSHQPGSRMRRALTEAKRYFIVARDDPRTALAHLSSRQDIALATGVQTVASSCAAVGRFAASDWALVLDAERGGGDAARLAVTIARHLELPIDERGIAQAVRGLELAALETPADIEAWWDGLDAGARAVAAGALDPYRFQVDEEPAGSFSWAPELFVKGDRTAEPATGPIDITGRARCLLHGPRIMLPPGSWSAAVALDFSPAAAEHSFDLELKAGAQTDHVVIRPEPGRFEANLGLSLEDLSDEPVSLTLSNQRAAFDGSVTLLDVILTRKPEPGVTLSGAPAHA
ncbi:MAG: hypothetical protein JO305_06895 [Alphaproteobacteria bacterium]|nr:hypothetical protein [Alphaproteobacteria bacterium]